METLAESISSLGHKVYVLAPFDKKIATRIKRPFKFITYRYVYPDKLSILGYGRTLSDDKEMGLAAYILSPLLYFFGFFALLKLAKKEKIDIISSHWIIPDGFIAALVAKLTKIPFTTTIPGSDIYMGGKNALFRWMVGFAAKEAKYVLSDSKYFLKRLEALDYHPKKTRVIRYGVNTKNFKPGRKDKGLLAKYGLTGSTPVILATGRLVSKKGFIYLINVLPSVLSRIPEAKLVIVGDGDQRKNLEDRTKTLEVEKKVIFAGMIPFNQLQKYYNIADVLVAPSIQDDKGNIDASPVSMMEAMACGVPIVGTKFSGGNLIIEGKTGYLVDPKNTREIGEAIIKILSRKDKRDFKINVRQIVQNEFSGKKVAKIYEEVFKEIV